MNDLPSPVVGLATRAGLAASAGQFATALVTMIEGADTASIVTFAGALVTLLTVLGGRYAQAVALARRVAREVKPVVDELAR